MQGAFEVQPSYTLLFLEFGFLAVTLVVWFIRRREESQSVSVVGGPAEVAKIVRRQTRRLRAGEDERMRQVPIPWGWPNCTRYRGRRSDRTMSEALHGFVDVLFREKQLVSEAAADPRIVNSIRALIEDRHHRVDREQAVNGTGTAPVDEDIWFVGPVAETRAAANSKYRSNLHEIRELRAPWGW